MGKSRTDIPTRIRNRYGRFAQIPVQLVRNPQVTDRAVRVYALLWSYSDEKTRDAWPSRASMAADLGVSVDTIDRGIRELAEARAIAVEADYHGVRQTSNVYTILVLPDDDSVAEVIHRGRRFAAGGAADLRLPGAADLRLQDQEPEDQDLGPVPDVTNDGPVDNSGTGPTPATVSRTHQRRLHAPDVFAAVGHWLPTSFDDDQLSVLADEILDQAPTHVADPTGYVIRSIRNTVRPRERQRGRWLLRADEIALEHQAVKGRF